VAELFVAAGASVVICGRDETELQATRLAIQNQNDGASIVAIPCDVTDEAAVKQLFKQIHADFKRLDVLVANAGVLDDALIGMTTRGQIERTFAVNSFGVLYCCQYAARMMARNPGGSMILMSSIIGRFGNSGQAVYAGSKAAVIGIAQSLAKELAPHGIRVNAIAPGLIDTEMAKLIPADKFAERVESIKMGRVGSPAEVANAVLFLASDLSSYVTGQTLGVDGGMLI
jgi:3-oxoacyl-[acyl-carrier protein] reductase